MLRRLLISRIGGVLLNDGNTMENSILKHDNVSFYMTNHTKFDIL
jgi:hypothetical protein